MMNRSISCTLSLLLLTSIAIGQTAYLQLTPGKSVRADADSKLGQSVSKVSDTPPLLEYRGSDGQKLYVQLRDGSEMIDRIEVLFDQPAPRSALAGMYGLKQAASSKWDSQGRLEEYFDAPHYMVLTHASSDLASPLIRAGYYGPELFALAMQKAQGQPRKADPSASPQSMGATSNPGGRAAVKMFKNVDLMVPKGDKSESKSVRLLFDGQYMVIDADGGEKIYKEFPYASIVSGEYSYSSSPRWKTAIGAAVLIGVFALPIFFMKGKKHWLTVKTANDFAIMRLDKDNYKVILATFETTVGKKVEMVNDDK